MCDVHTWKCQRVGKWLKRAGFPQYVQSFTQEHRIDGMALLSLTEMDLRSPPLELKVLGDIKRLMLAIRKLQRENQYHLAITQRLENGTRLRHREFMQGNGSDFAESDGFTHSDDSSSENRVYIPTFKPEIWKTVISFLYVFLVFLVTAFVMVIVHDRVPDREKFPPLPDLFLDSVPRIPWAFVMCEITGLVLCAIWCIVLLLHKHRFILMRRMFALTGTVFMLRCLTMLMTSLSVPGDHLGSQDVVNVCKESLPCPVLNNDCLCEL